MAIMFVRAQVISRGAGRSVVSAAAYRHRTGMEEEQTGTRFRYDGGKAELVHEELALPRDAPAWLTTAIDGKTCSGASEVLWNAVDAFEKRADAQLAREMILALPEELSKAQNIALVREFVDEHLTLRGMVADWVYHDKDGNPHVHVMTTLRPLSDDGFGPKKVAVRGDDGKRLRVVTPGRAKGKIVYRLWAGDAQTLQAWKIGWAQTASRHLALAGHDIRLDGRSYCEQGLEGIAQSHLGPAKAALARKRQEMYFAPAALARRQQMADRLADEPGLLLKQLSGERSTFDERDIARFLHRDVDDPVAFANIRAQLMASPDLVVLKPQRIDTDTGKVSAPAIFTTRAMLRTEYDMARSAVVLSRRSGFLVRSGTVDRAVREIEGGDRERPFRLDGEQVDAVRHVTGDGAIAAVVGLAGAGKSTLLEAARIAWQADGRRVIGGALAGKAAQGLEESAGIASRTLAAWELAWARGTDKLQKGDVLVVDEAGMVSSRQLARILESVEEAGAKVVLVGDPMQLQPIQAGAALRAIVERIGFAQLTGIRRQREDWACEASRLLARGHVEQALDAHAHHARIVELDTRDAVIERIVADWGAARLEYQGQSDATDATPSGSRLLVLAHTNDNVRKLNEAIRAVMADQNALAMARAFETERGQREFAIGDRLIFLENARFVERGAAHAGVQQVRNGMLGTVVSTTGKRGATRLTVKLDAGGEVTFGSDTYCNVDHGYAATIHKSQGVTVDRTFVLASAMMDRHLTYVALSRHRDRADLYMAKEDFQPNTQWGKGRRVDHAAGVTGELVETGEVKFPASDDDVGKSPYADVRIEDGSIHRVWGVSLPEALHRGGVAIGDTVTLRKNGVEQVSVKVAVVDERTGCRTFEERVVERNVWTARQIETVDVRQARLERESYRPERFRHLVERLSRSGAKTTTLDYETGEGYRAQVVDFARRRNMDHAAEIAAAMEEGFERQLAWISARRNRVAVAWQRASVALGFVIEKARGLVQDDDAVRRADLSRKAQPASDMVRSAHARQETFARSLEDDARAAHLASARWKEREAILLPLLTRIYRHSEEALTRLNERIAGSHISPRRLADDLGRDPSMLGALRGGDHLVDGRAARNERMAALAAVAELVPLARGHGEQYRRDEPGFLNREQARRSAMSVSQVSTPAPAAMLAAVTVFATGIDEEARQRAGQAAFYRQRRARLVEDAQNVWRDPAAALAVIEGLVVKGVDPERIARAVQNDPSSYGALRGSGRIMDRLLARGRERRQANQTVAPTAASVRSMGQAWQGAFEAERDAVRADRRRMAIAVPRLSARAEAALAHLGPAIANRQGDINALVQRVDADVRAELALVNKALDARFGPGAIARGDGDVIDRVPAQQRKFLKAMQPKLRVLQLAVQADHAHDIIAERRMRALKHGNAIRR